MTVVKKVLIIGIDGCRPDSLQAASTPILDSLASEGAYSFEAYTCQFTKSGPCWASMLTGVWPEKHHVVNNSMVNAQFDQYPHFFQRLKEARPETNVASIVNWAPIHEKIVRAADLSTACETDDEVAKEATRLLANSDPDVLFLHFDDVDNAGHRNGYGPTAQGYLDAISEIDRRIEGVLATIRERRSFGREGWLILAGSDHGGSTSKAPGQVKAQHGDDIPEHRTVFLIVSGSAAERGPIEPPPVVVDVPPTVFKHLGIEVEADWDWDGRSVGLR